jgi:hypothetical protein
LDISLEFYEYSKIGLAGAGTQTAALGFGGNPPIQEQQKNMMEQVGQLLLQVWQLQEAFLAGAGTQSISFSFWWRYSKYNSSNRRMDRCRSTINKNNNGKLIWQNI